MSSPALLETGLPERLPPRTMSVRGLQPRAVRPRSVFRTIGVMQRFEGLARRLVV